MGGFLQPGGPSLRYGVETLLLSIPLAIAGCSNCRTAAQERLTLDPDFMLVEVGAELFAAYCASCHGVDARGDGPAAAALKTPPTDLTAIATRNGGVFPDGAIARTIDGRFDLPAHGSREMPVWGVRLADEIPCFATGEEVARGRIASLVEYLKTLQLE
jgi:mono/diheme cytochrome c family protein